MLERCLRAHRGGKFPNSFRAALRLLKGPSETALRLLQDCSWAALGVPRAAPRLQLGHPLRKTAVGLPRPCPGNAPGCSKRPFSSTDQTTHCRRQLPRGPGWGVPPLPCGARSVTPPPHRKTNRHLQNKGHTVDLQNTRHTVDEGRGTLSSTEQRTHCR